MDYFKKSMYATHFEKKTQLLRKLSTGQHYLLKDFIICIAMALLVTFIQRGRCKGSVIISGLTSVSARVALTPRAVILTREPIKLKHAFLSFSELARV